MKSEEFGVRRHDGALNRNYPKTPLITERLEMLSTALQMKVLNFVGRVSASVTRHRANRRVTAQKPRLTRPTVTASIIDTLFCGTVHSSLLLRHSIQIPFHGVEQLEPQFLQFPFYVSNIAR